MKKVVYTCILNDYDDLVEPNIVTPGWEYILITDRDYVSNVWKQIKIDTTGQDVKKLTRRIFAMPFEYFDADISVLVSGRVNINVDLDMFVNAYLPNGYDMSIHNHPRRSCVYSEGFVIIKKNIDNRNTVLRQLKKYRREHYPRNNGLVAAGLMIRRHNDAVKRFGRLWWNETSANSYRDQLSFNYIVWKHKGISIYKFPFKYKNKMFIVYPHKKKA